MPPFLLLLAVATAPRVPLLPGRHARRLSELAPTGAGGNVSAACATTAGVAVIACPALMTEEDGDDPSIRSMCACGISLIERLFRDCQYAWSPPPGMCAGDCARLRDQHALEEDVGAVFAECDVSVACAECWEAGAASAACAQCRSECFEYAHCFAPDGTLYADDVTGAPNTPPLALAGCADVERAHAASGCCGGGEGATGEPPPLYVRADALAAAFFGAGA